MTDQGEIFSKKLKNEKKALVQYIANIKNIADSFKLGFISNYQDSTPEAVCVFHALKAILNNQEVKTALETQRITKQNANVIEKISTQANKLKDYAVFFRNLIMKPKGVYEDRLKNIIEYERTIKDLERKIEIANTLKDLQESHNKDLEEIKKIKENEKRNFLLGQKQSVEQEVIERERNWESAIKNYGSKDKEAVTGNIQCINTLLMWYKTAFFYKQYQINEYLKKLQLDEKETTFVKSFPGQDAELQKKVNAMEKFAAQLLGFNIDWTGVEILEKGDCIVFTGLSLLDPFLSAMDIDFWITETSKFNENEEVKKQKPQQNDSSKNDLQQPKNSQDTLILAELRETNNGLNGQIATLQAQSQEQVHNAENQIAELQRENVGRAEAAKRVVRNDTENAVRNEVAEEHNAHIASLNYDNGLALKAKDEKIEELQNKNAGLEKQLIDAGLKPQDVEYVGRGSSTVFKEDEESKEDKKQLEITVKHQNEVIVRYEAELKKNAETIKKLEVTVNKQRKELDEIKNKKESEEGNEFLEMIDQKQKMLDGLQKELEDKDTLQNKKQAELDAREKLINQREKSINSKNGRNSRLLRQKMNSTVNKPVAATAA